MTNLNKAIMKEMQLFAPMQVQIKKECISLKHQKAITLISGVTCIEEAIPNLIDAYCNLSINKEQCYLDYLAYEPKYDTIEKQFVSELPASTENQVFSIPKWKLLLIIFTCESNTYEGIISEMAEKVTNSMALLFGEELLQLN